jgi:hypothetical protein
MSTHEHPQVNLPIAQVMFLAGIAVRALGLLGLPAASDRPIPSTPTCGSAATGRAGQQRGASPDRCGLQT